ncbi:MAG: acetyl-CoA carboxylase biotin carboxyl carrier protein subunit [Chloroflexi bacterium]|nr:acetyl-CoA carboxylase biotin carboxyl carrier protein subunit [Chloroflexota bacterium]
MKYVATIDDKDFSIEIVDDRHVRVGERLIAVDFESVSGQPVYSLIFDGKSFESFVYQGRRRLAGASARAAVPVKVEDEREKRLRAAAGGGVAEGGEFHLKAPMPGLVVAIPVSEGQEVKKGQVLVILESMKMQNELKAPRDGVVHHIKAKAGESVEQKQVLLNLQ